MCDPMRLFVDEVLTRSVYALFLVAKHMPHYQNTDMINILNVIECRQ
jgi:hypothetical protein